MKLVLALLLSAAALACGTIEESALKELTGSPTSARLAMFILILLSATIAGLAWARVLDKFGRVV